MGARRPPAQLLRLRSRSARRRRRARRRPQRAVRGRLRHASHAALPRLASPRSSSAQGADDSRTRASCSPRRTRAKSSASPACCRSTGVPYRLGSRNEAAGQRHGLLRVQLSRRRPAHARHRQDAAIADWRADARSRPDATARQIVLFGAQDLTDDADVARAPGPPRQVQDRRLHLRLPRSRRRRLRRPRRTRHRPLLRPARHRRERRSLRSS